MGKHLMMTFILIFTLVGALAGLMGGLMGIGGGIIVIPSLVFLFQYIDFPHEKIMQLAVGTSLAAMVFTSGSSAWAHYKKNGLNLKIIAQLFPGIFFGSIIGAYLAGILHSETLKVAFSIFVAAVGLSLLFAKNQAEGEGIYLSPRPTLLAFIGLFIGSLSSFFGLGGGIITVPILTHLRMPVKTAISVSAITSFLIAIVGTVSFVYIGFKKEGLAGTFGYIYLPAFVPIGITAAICAPLGAYLSHHLPTKVIQRIFGLFLLGVSVLLNLRT